MAFLLPFLHTFQGNRLIDIAEDSKEPLRLSCESAYCGGEIAGAALPEPVEGGVSEGGQILGGVTSENRAAVLVERGVAHVMQAVFNRAPMSSDEFQKFRSRGTMTWNRGHEVSGLEFATTFDCPFARNAEDLLDTRPVEMTTQGCRGRDRSFLQATVSLVHRLAGSPLRRSFPLSEGGKRPMARR